MDRDTVKPLKELLDSVRDTDGFPIAKDEDILALSDPPFYTACPNPYMKQFIEEYGTLYDPDNDNYHREPYIEDVVEPRSGGIYDSHTYYTKVPHKAIMKYIKHYTKEGDIVFDGFCGTGMTGVAAQLINRRAILVDLSPSATFISNGYCRYISPREFTAEAKKIVREAKSKCRWLYRTNHASTAINTKTGKQSTLFALESKISTSEINYMIWSDVFICPYCNHELIFYHLGVDIQNSNIQTDMTCPHCNSTTNKNNAQRVLQRKFDTILRKEVTIAKQVPVLINYSVNNQTYFKKPDKEDFSLMQEIERSEIPYEVPIYKIPPGDNTSQPMNSHNVTYFHQFFKKRMLWVISYMWDKANKSKIKNYILFLLTSYINTHSTTMTNIYLRKRKFVLTNKSPNNLSIPSLGVEKNFIKGISSKIKSIAKIYETITPQERVIIGTNSITKFGIPDNSVDYVFTDPPFGGNLMYSELSIFWEAWLSISENNKYEAIINKHQGKSLEEYTELMSQCLKEYYRILKPNRWITVEFHNSKASVWNAIQESITRAGFMIAQVTILDKKQRTFKQVTSPGAVEKDLIINAYKPKTDFSKRFLKNAGEGMEIDFVIQQLEHLPVKPNIERTEKMLYSKMLAHYVENGFKIKYDSTNFYKLLSDNLVELNGYWFLDSQVKEYNKWKSGLSLEQIKNVLDGQQVLFVSDEKSALAWLYNFLHQPRTYSEIYTAYQKVATTTDDRIPELKELLNNNFMPEDGKYRRPISREEREGINKNRERELDRTFQKLLKQAIEQKGRIRNVRREALIHGFTKCYQEGRYQDILTVANKLYASTLEASGDIMDFVDIARIKTSGEERKQRTVDNEFPLWR